MKTSNFFSALKDNFGRFDIRPEVIEALEDHYGCGYEDPRGRHENIAWKDFCEDVDRSKEYDDSKGVAECMAMTRGATLSFDALADVDDVYSDELQGLAAADGARPAARARRTAASLVAARGGRHERGARPLPASPGPCSSLHARAPRSPRLASRARVRRACAAVAVRARARRRLPRPLPSYGQGDAHGAEPCGERGDARGGPRPADGAAVMPQAPARRRGPGVWCGARTHGDVR